MYPLQDVSWLNSFLHLKLVTLIVQKSFFPVVMVQICSLWFSVSVR